MPCRVTEENEPNGLNIENCGILQLDITKPMDQNSWRDIPCVLNSVKYYICEYQPNSETGRWAYRFFSCNLTRKLNDKETPECLNRRYLRNGVFSFVTINLSNVRAASINRFEETVQDMISFQQSSYLFTACLNRLFNTYS